MYRCPACGSTRLAWDHRAGYVVCTQCGVIIEQIFDEDGNTPTQEEGDGGAEAWRPPLPRLRTPRSARIEAALKAYDEARRLGMGRRRALEYAAEAAGLSLSTVRNAVLRYRLREPGRPLGRW